MERLYATHDHWHVIATVNNSSEPTGRFAYAAFGAAHLLAANFDNTMNSRTFETLYGAYRCDFESGLYRARHRLLHANVGSWITRDPFKEYGDRNLYWYVDNASANYVDPLGLEKIITDQTNGFTYWITDDCFCDAPCYWRSRSAVTSDSKPGAGGPYDSADVFPTAGPYKNDPGGFGPNDILKTCDSRGRWIHGGGGPDYSDPRQGWYPTHGCTRMQNEDIQDLVNKVREYKNEHNKPVPYSRHSCPPHCVPKEYADCIDKYYSQFCAGNKADPAPPGTRRAKPVTCP